MGVSIFSGSLTTFGAGAFLFGGQMVVFQKFAVLITSTIVLSFVSSMLLFGSLCHIMGPQGNKGSLVCSFESKSN